MLSISSLFYIIVGQYLFSRVLRLAPISGYAAGRSTPGASWCCRCGLALLARLGGEARLYRAMFLEEIGKDYVRTARAKGLSEGRVLTRHVLRNALIPIVTSAGGYLPYVFLGSLVFESFFGLPGLGAYVIDAIASQDFAIVRTMVFLGSAALRRELCPDRRGLHLDRSAGAAGMTAPDDRAASGGADMPLPSSPSCSGPTPPSGCWSPPVLAYAVAVLRSAGLRRSWRRVFADAPALASSVVLCCASRVTLLDSVHWRARAAGGGGRGARRAGCLRRAHAFAARRCCSPGRGVAREELFAAARRRRLPEGIDDARRWPRRARRASPGARRRASARPRRGSAPPTSPGALWPARRRRWRRSPRPRRCCPGCSRVAAGVTAATGARGAGGDSSHAAQTAPLPWRVRAGHADARWLLASLAGPALALMNHWHVLGTDRTGNDVLYQSLKSIRTAFVIGSLATVATLPFAVVLGIMAGYLRGWVDEAIQYFYTVLSSVPGVLLIAACVLMVQVFLDTHPERFETGVERADLKLFLLCAVLGITGWAGLARLLRAETLKLRELEYVQAAQAFGVGAARIMARHIFPNVAHLMLIVTVLEFSSLILYEAVLSYVGVGVDPTMNSFGGMINLARLEMSLDPVVWWSFAAAFGFMVALVLAANLFADGVRDAFDPRAARLWRRPAAGRRRTSSRP